jgi:hypothetical protein
MATRKITVEIEMTEEEAERIERFFEAGCYDVGKYFKRLILGVINRKQELALVACRRREVKKAV